MDIDANLDDSAEFLVNVKKILNGSIQWFSTRYILSHKN